MNKIKTAINIFCFIFGIILSMIFNKENFMLIILSIPIFLFIFLCLNHLLKLFN